MPFCKPFIISFTGCFRRLKSALEPEQRIAQVTLAADLEGKPFVGLHVSGLDARLLQRRSSPPGIFGQLEDHGIRATQRARFRNRRENGLATIKASQPEHRLGNHTRPIARVLPPAALTSAASPARACGSAASSGRGPL